MKTETEKIQWHPGFYGAAELELIQNKDVLEFEREYNLSKEPLRVDLLIVKKRADVKIENEIGHIFRRFNVLEYKSPDDALSIDDYFKTVGYACLYKGLGKTVDAVPAGELTVSLFRESYPREMMEALKELGAAIEQRYPGIYYVTGYALFPTQIVVTGQLRREPHSSLRVLSKNVQEEDARRFLLAAEQLATPGDKHNADAVLQVSVSASTPIYNKIKEESAMCEALQKLMKDEIDQKVAAGLREGLAEGRAKGRAEGRAEGRVEGRAEGRVEGRAEGRVEGRAEGRVEGRAEGEIKRAAETAYRMADGGMSVETIAKFVDFDVETVKQWLAQRGKA